MNQKSKQQNKVINNRQEHLDHIEAFISNISSNSLRNWRRATIILSMGCYVLTIILDQKKFEFSWFMY